MKFEELWTELNQLSVACGMNQRFTEQSVADAVWWTWIVNSAVVLTTMTCMGLTIAAFCRPAWKLRCTNWSIAKVSLAASVLSAVAGVLLVATPFVVQPADVKIIHQAWADLRTDTDSAVHDLEQDGDVEYAARRLRDLQERKNQVNLREQMAGVTMDDETAALYLEKEEVARGQKPLPPADKWQMALNVLRSPRWWLLALVGIGGILVGASLSQLRLKAARPAPPATGQPTA